jgi:lactoylglutathione lyase
LHTLLGRSRAHLSASVLLSAAATNDHRHVTLSWCVIMLLRLLLLAIAHAASAQRLLHWVIRVSSLEETVAFTTDVLGMKVLRHEENAEPCPLTCNGVYNTPWSKTMVGYGPEDGSYALELTYNYGIEKYEPGEGLRHFVLHVPNARDVLERARAKGLQVDGNMITGPDAYHYELLEADAATPVEPFRSVVLSAADPAALAKWYADVVGMTAEDMGSSWRVSFPGSSLPVAFTIVPTAGSAQPKIEQWEGRNAIALPEKDLRAINERLVKEAPELIIHSMRELHEKLGTLFILIVRDIGGFEVCLVSIETFDPSVREATNYVGPDWEERKAVREKVVGQAAHSAAVKKMHDEIKQAMARRANGEAADDEDEDEDDEDEDDEEVKADGKQEL